MLYESEEEKEKIDKEMGAIYKRRPFLSNLIIMPSLLLFCSYIIRGIYNLTVLNFKESGVRFIYAILWLMVFFLTLIWARKYTKHE